MTGPLISAAELHALMQSDGPPVLLDCGFDLFDVQAGERAWQDSHLPGAYHAHLERDLSGPKSAQGPIVGGRHPLPTREAWADRVGAWGIAPRTQVVVYDDQGGPYAARAWWMLRWLGHDRVRVLDGGKGAWRAAGYGLVSAASGAAQPTSPPKPYPLSAAGTATVDADGLSRSLGAVTLVDARAGERFRGETEPLDTRAGHIPGAVNRFFKDNLAPDGRFKPPEQLRREWAVLLRPGADVVHQCGSGVTACHNLLAQHVAGLGEGVLYPGSWSEWSADPTRPLAAG